jgi:hypothetical protein
VLFRVEGVVGASIPILAAWRRLPGNGDVPEVSPLRATSLSCLVSDIVEYFIGNGTICKQANPALR